MGRQRISWASHARNRRQSAYPLLWTGLKGLWAPALGATGLTLFDASPMHRNAPFAGTLAASDWTQGDYGDQLTFNGTSGERATIGQLTLGAEFTLLAFINDSTSGWVMDCDAGSGFRSIGIEGGKWSFLNRKESGATVYWMTATTPLPDQGWHLLAGVHSESSGGTLYLDGVPIDTNASTGAEAGYTGNTVLGQAYSVGRYFYGDLSMAAIYDRALTPSEIQIYSYRFLAPLELDPGYYPVGVAAGGTTIFPAAVSASWSVPSPTLSSTITPAAVVVTWSVGTPTLSSTISPAAVSSNWSVPAPTLTKTIAPDAVSAAWAVPVPSTGATTTSVEPDPVTAFWAVPVPALAKTITPAAVSAAWSTPAPTLEKNITPDPVTATWTVPAPILSGVTKLPPGLFQSGHYHMGV